MSSIDERVVEAKFDNRQFQAGVQGTLNSLDNLKKGLNLEGAAKGFEGMTGSVDKVKRHIDVMRISALVAIATIAHQAVRAGENLIKAFTLDPIKAGLESYNEQINATQVILANTKAQGTTLKDVTATLADLQQYANLTVYSFSDMTSNIGKFTAAGVKLGPATAAIKGMANVAALSGANTQQMSSAMYQMSQALSTGVIRLQDWNSLSNANMAGQNVQKALEATAHSMGKAGVTMDAAIKKGGNFRNSLQQGWLTAGIFTKTMKIMAGTIDQSTGKMKAFTVEQIRHMGYSEKDAKQLQVLSQSALDSAIKIRTIPQMTQALKEEVATAYSSVFKTVFGDINQATTLFTQLHNVLENALTGPIYAFNKTLQGWAKMGGRIALIEGVKNAFAALMSIINPIKAAFREIFPAQTAATLYKMTTDIAYFFGLLKLGKKQADELKRTFAGLFAILDIAWQLIKAGVKFLAGLIAAVGKSSGGILKFTAHLGDFLVALDKAIKHGDSFGKAFALIGKIFIPLVTTLGYTRIRVLDMANGITHGLGTFLSVMKEIPKVFHTIDVKIHEVFNNMFTGFNFQNMLQLFNAGLFAGLLLLVRKFINHLTRDKSGEGIQGFINKITEPFHQLTDTLKEMQRAIQVATILEIAIAVGILTASVIALSFVDPKKLASALGAMTVMFGQLIGTLALLQAGKIGGGKGLAATSAGLILFATALRILTSSVVSLARLSWEQLAKGLGAVTVLLGGLVVASRGLSKDASGMIRTGAGLTILAFGIKLLADAVKEIGGLSWGEIEKGLVGVGALLASLAIFSRLVEAGKAGVLQGAGLLLLAVGIKLLADAVGKFSKMHWQDLGKGMGAISAILLAVALFSRGVGNPVKMVAASASLIAIGTAMTILAAAMKIFGTMDWEQIAKGLVSMGGALAIIAIAMDAMPITSVLSAAALMGVSVALVAIGGALKVMGSMSWTDIAQSLVELGGALSIIADAMDLMLFALPGAAALLVVSAALAILVPELALLGSMSWGDILKALVGLGGALAIIAIAGVALTEAIPSLFGLAGSIALLGVGLALIGGSVYLFATGLQILAISGAAAGDAIKLLVTDVVQLVPMLAKAIGDTIVALAKAIAIAAPAIYQTMITAVDMMLNAVNREGPKLISTFFRLVWTLLQYMVTNVGKFSNAALDIVLGILHAIEHKTPAIVDAVANIVVRMLNALAHRMGDLTTAGANLIIAFIQGLSKQGVRIADASGKAILDFLNGLDAAVNKYEPQIIDAGVKLMGDIAAGLAKGLVGVPERLGKALGGGILHWAGKAVGRGSPAKEFIKLAQDINAGLMIGLVGGHDQIISTWNDLVDKTKTALEKSKDDIKKYQDRLDTLEKAHKKNPKAIRETIVALQEAHLEYDRSSAILTELNKHETKHYATLRSLGAQYDSLKQQIDDANQALKDAIQVRDDYNKSVTDQYSTLPDVANDTKLSDYETGVKKQIVNTQSFIDVLAQLRAQGLDDTQYKNLVAKGPDALPFAEQVLAGGKAAVDELNTLDSQLQQEAQALGTAASSELYQAGVNTAQGLVDGLESKLSTVENEMTKIAKAMVAALKKELKIKSPSEVFGDMGVFSGQGLASGLIKSMPHIQKATQTLGKNTIESMKESIRQMNDLMATEGNMNPTIKPVLDLSSVRKQATGVSSLLSARLAMNAAYSKAVSASAGYEANVNALAPGDNTQTPSTNVTLIQNNNSPKALSTAEIYRNTNNQLSRVKGALNPSAP